MVLRVLNHKGYYYLQVPVCTNMLIAAIRDVMAIIIVTVNLIQLYNAP